MFISRMALNPARAEGRRLIGSPYRLHAAVEQAFPPGIDRQTDEGRILWRLDVPQNASDAVWLYIVSPARPDLTHVVEQAGWPAVYANGWETKDYAPLLDRLESGQVWRFRLKANPVRKVACDKGRMPDDRVVGTLRGHVTVAQQTEWLMSRAVAHGFAIVEDSEMGPVVSISQRHKEEFRRGDERVTISTARFDGILKIVDAEAFRRTLCQGIGRAKGFGCGLLTVAPLEGGASPKGGAQ